VKFRFRCPKHDVLFQTNAKNWPTQDGHADCPKCQPPGPNCPWPAWDFDFLKLQIEQITGQREETHRISRAALVFSALSGAACIGLPCNAEATPKMSNRFVSFLKKAGQVLVAAEPIVAEALPALAPLLNLVTPKKDQAVVATVESAVVSDVALMSQSVLSVETAANVFAQGGSTVTGAQKAQAAGVAILQIFENSAVMVGKKIADPAGAKAAAAKIAGGVADFWNAVDGNVLPNVSVSSAQDPAPSSSAPAPAPAPAASVELPTE
jgi:hypothetical protein